MPAPRRKPRPSAKAQGVKRSNKAAPASTPEKFIAAIDEPRRSEIAKVHAFIQKTLPARGFEPYMMTGMGGTGTIAYGSFHYRTSSGRESDWFRVGLASNKQYISLYVCAWNGRVYVAEQYKKQLPKASIGKSCVRFKSFDDLDPKIVRAMLNDALKTTCQM